MTSKKFRNYQSQSYLSFRYRQRPYDISWRVGFWAAGRHLNTVILFELCIEWEY